MVCEMIDKDGKQHWCEKHKAYHPGHLAEYARDPGEKGKRFRDLWDRIADGTHVVPKPTPIPKQPATIGEKKGCCGGGGTQKPNLIQKARNYLADLADHVAGGSVCVPPSVRAGRRVHCDTCNHRNKEKDECNLCGCPLHETVLGDKLAWAISRCPVDKWGKWNGAHEPNRHLLFHLWPRKLSMGTWQRNLDQLKHRWKLFNGKRIIAVATSSDSHDLETVQAYMQGYDCEWIHVENDPKLREVKTFLPLFERVQEYNGDNHFIFYAQGKGVTKPVNSRVSIHPWTSMMYEVLLDYWPLMEEMLTQYPVIGAFKKNIHGFTGSKSDWHYSGSFCWFRAKDLYARAWRKIDQVWYGIESWPSLHYPRAEAGCLFYERDEKFSLYNMQTIGQVERELQEWRKKHSASRSNTGSLMNT